MSQMPASGPRKPYEERSGTVLETDEDVRQALLSGIKGMPQSAPTSPRPVAPPVPAAEHTANLYRPTARPPVAELTVLDDGKSEGEVIRIRDHRFVIGRAEGDLRIPIDGRISSRHVEITLQAVGGVHRWVVTDLRSTHGMFVRVSRTALADKAEIFVGNGRYRFDVPQAVGEGTADHVSSGPITGETQGWEGGPSPFRPPALTELLGDEIGNRVLLVKPEYWIGADPSCAISRTDDPFCEPKHVRLYRGQKGTWNAEHNKTRNGLWLRMSQIVAEAVIHFQIGEQRFRLKVQ
jgi:pSer/pThr/pTyr-binding forkhead associated (FHA) protein